MEAQGRYRHELKYLIGPADYRAVRQRLRLIMRRDAHARTDGTYVIRSIYFDNFEDKALREKLDGVQRREKFRIRYYNDNYSFFTLEKKIKHNDLCMKLDARLTEEECRALLTGSTDWMPNHASPLVGELYCKMKLQQLRPRVLVSYVREPYVYEAGNVRVTFDSQIRSTLFHRAFLEPQLHDVDVADSPGERILEVKFDAFLPGIIAAALQTGSVRRQAFSKYSACRRFG